MVSALEIVLAVGVVWVAGSYWLAADGRLGRRVAIGVAAALGLLGAACLVLMAVGLAVDRWDWRELAITGVAFLVLALAQLGALEVARGLARTRDVDELEAQMLARLDTAVDVHADARVRELEQTLARERAETIHLLGEQERALREQRRTDLAGELESAQLSLTETVSQAQRRLEERLTAWSSDLERAQQQLKARLEELIRRQADALKMHEQRLAGHAVELGGLEEHQAATVARLRTELEQLVTESLQSARSDIEIHAVERRRALHEVGDRLRTRERTMREQIEREEGEVKVQLATAIAEAERRTVEQLSRGLDRAVVRLSEDAERQFDRQLRDSRERTAERLSRELELSMEHFMKAAENEVVNRIAEAAQVSASRFERQIDDLVHAAEVQTGISNERITALTDRLEKSLEAAHERLNAFEAHVELELSAKLGEIERTLRAAGQAAERAQTRT